MFGKALKDGEFCPLVKGECVRHKCAFFTKLVGLDPQSGQHIDKFGCAIAWLPVLLVENSQQQRQTAASVDKVSGQIVKVLFGALPEPTRDRLTQ